MHRPHAQPCRRKGFAEARGGNDAPFGDLKARQVVKVRGVQRFARDDTRPVEGIIDDAVARGPIAGGEGCCGDPASSTGRLNAPR